MKPLTDERISDVLWHTIGMTSANYRKKIEWWLDNENHRNHWNEDIPHRPEYGEVLYHLVRKEWMIRGSTAIGGGSCYFHLTPLGIREARSRFFARNSQSKRKQRA